MMEDRQVARRLEERRVVITEVNVPKNYVLGKDAWGNPILVNFSFHDAVVTVPQVGELWYAQRRDLDWVLGRKAETGKEQTTLAILSPGDRRLEATNDLHLNAGGQVLVNGAPLGAGVAPHQATHQSGGTDALVGDVDANARLNIRKDGTSIATRRGLNFITGSNMTITAADNSANERIDITLASSGGGTSGGGTIFEYTINSTVNPGATSIVLNATPTAHSKVPGYWVIGPLTTNCETRSASTEAGGATVSLNSQRSYNPRGTQFVASTKTIRWYRNISNISKSGSTITVVTSEPHGFSTGESVSIWATQRFNTNPSVTADGLSGITVVDSTTFTFSDAVGLGTPSAETSGRAYRWGVSQHYGYQFRTGDTFKVTGSTSNNGIFTVAGVASDGDSITVNETLIDEFANLAASFTWDIQKSHAIGTKVWWVPGTAVPAAWYGLKGDSSDEGALVQRMINDCTSVGAAQVWRGTYGTTRPILVTAGIPLGPNFSLVGLSGFVSPTAKVGILSNVGTRGELFALSKLDLRYVTVNGNNIALRSGTDGVTNGTNTFTSATGSFTSADLGRLLTIGKRGARRITAINSTTSINFSGDTIESFTGLTWAIDGIVGIAANIQQQSHWEKVRSDSCSGINYYLTGQQANFYNIESINGGTGVWLEGAEFMWFYGLDVEQQFSQGVFLNGCSSILISGGHNEHNAIPAFHIGGSSRGLIFDAIEISNHASGGINFWVTDGRAGYSIRRVWSNGSAENFPMIQDDPSGINLDQWTHFRNMVAEYHSAESTSSTSYDDPYGWTFAGSGGRMVFMGGSVLSNPTMTLRPGTGQTVANLRWTDSSGNEKGNIDPVSGAISIGGPKLLGGSGSPEGAVAAPVGSIYMRSDGGSGTSVYNKESGTGNTGWVADAGGGSGSAVVTNPATTAANTITSSAIGAVSLTIKQASGQTALLLDLRDSSNAAVLQASNQRVAVAGAGLSYSFNVGGTGIDSAGYAIGGATAFAPSSGWMVLASGFASPGATQFGRGYFTRSIQYAPSNAQLVNTLGYFEANATTEEQVVIEQYPAQTTDMVSLVTDTKAAILSRFNKDGYFMTRKTAAPADADIATSEMALWFDNTAGAAKLMIKAKDSGGTVRTGSVSLT
jgi:hypothetical protein